MKQNLKSLGMRRLWLFKALWINSYQKESFGNLGSQDLEQEMVVLGVSCFFLVGLHSPLSWKEHCRLPAENTLPGLWGRAAQGSCPPTPPGWRGGCDPAPVTQPCWGQGNKEPSRATEKQLRTSSKQQDPQRLGVREAQGCWCDGLEEISMERQNHPLSMTTDFCPSAETLE